MYRSSNNSNSTGSNVRILNNSILFLLATFILLFVSFRIAAPQLSLIEVLELIVTPRINYDDKNSKSSTISSTDVEIEGTSNSKINNDITKHITIHTSYRNKAQQQQKITLQKSNTTSLINKQITDQPSVILSANEVRKDVINPSLSFTPSTPLYSLLESFYFYDSGTVSSSDTYINIGVTLNYGEPENISVVGHYAWYFGELQDGFPILFQKDVTIDDTCQLNQYENNKNRPGSDYRGIKLDTLSPSECAAQCCLYQSCQSWSLQIADRDYIFCRIGQPCCYLKNQRVSSQSQTGVLAGEGPSTRPFNKVPPTGMRSSVPIGGVGAGSFELRADGSMHEVMIYNQSPAGAGKFGVVDYAMMAIRVAPPSPSGEATKDKSKIVAKLIRTHPPSNVGLRGVDQLTYQGSYPVSKWNIQDRDLTDTLSPTIYAYSTFKAGDLNRSATPSAIFSSTFNNPTSLRQTVSFLFTLPLGIDYDHIRSKSDVTTVDIYNTSIVNSAIDCMHLCNEDKEHCQSWTYYNFTSSCTLNRDIPHNSWVINTASGLGGSHWSFKKKSESGRGMNGIMSSPLLFHRGHGLSDEGKGQPSSGEVSLWPSFELSSGEEEAEYSFNVGVGDNLTDLLDSFHEFGTVEELSDRNNPPSPESESFRCAAHGAVLVTVSIPPTQSVVLSIVMSWYLPDRDHVGAIVKNHYSSLFRNSQEVGESILGKKGEGIRTVVTEIANLHSIYNQTSLPDYLTDTLINSISHVRSAMYTGGGTWRQWEAFDCANIDSIHNDYQRHLPYMFYFPSTESHKIRSHASKQVGEGMLQEELSWAEGCIPIPAWDSTGGRRMGDTTTLFIVEVWQIYAWGSDEEAVELLFPSKNLNEKDLDIGVGINWLNEMHDHVVSAVKYLISQAPAPVYLPQNMLSTYDLINFGSSYSMYNSLLHLLAMASAMKILSILGDKETYQSAEAAFNSARVSIESQFWHNNHYYQSFASSSRHPLMSDALYAQVIAYTLGLGDLLPKERIALHLKSEFEYNDTPYGLLIHSSGDDEAALANERAAHKRPRSPTATGRDWDPNNSIWGQASQDWTALALWVTNNHDNSSLSHAYTQGEKAMNNWRHRLNDKWNVWGLISGEGLGYIDGGHWITSHYGFHMTIWHTPIAASRQNYYAPNHSLSFQPVGDIPYSYPVLLPYRYGKLTAEQSSEQEIAFRLTLTIGSRDLRLRDLSVNGVKYPLKEGEEVKLKGGETLQWTGPR